MQVNALIPARGGSKRIPRKNLINFCGKPLVVWSIEQALSSKGIDKVYVSSDSPEILRVAAGAGAEVIERPDELASDSSTLEQVIEHFLREVPTDILVVLQPTSPLRLPGDIEKAIEYTILQKFEALFSCHIENDLFMRDSKLQATTFGYKTVGDYRTVKDFYVTENGSYYIFTQCHRNGFKYRDRYAGYLGCYPQHKWQSYEIDEPEDIRVCEALMREFILKEGHVTK